MAATTFRIPGTIHYGPGALSELGPTARQLGFEHVLLVTDVGMVHLGLAGKAKHLLEEAGLEVAVFDGVQPDPTLDNVETGLGLLRQSNCDSIVALGGGSPIDCAKAIAICQANSEPLANFLGMEKVPKAGLPVIAVPTTAGTGSEVTRAMVITDTARDVKMMIASRHCICAAALVDPELTLSMPPALTAAVGVDALTHALEAYVSCRAQPLTDVLALSALGLISAHLRTACRDGSNLAARTAVMQGAMQAGMAFSNSSVALIHGMARPLGACFHLSHGHSIAVLLPVATAFSLSAGPERYQQAAAAIGVTDLVPALHQLNADVGIPSLAQLGVDRTRYESLLTKMAADALASGSPANNPRPASAAEIVELYRQAYQEKAA